MAAYAVAAAASASAHTPLSPPPRSRLPGAAAPVRRDQVRTYAQAQGGAGGGKRISQNDFTEKAWEAIISAPEVARGYSQQARAWGTAGQTTAGRACCCWLLWQGVCGCRCIWEPMGLSRHGGRAAHRVPCAGAVPRPAPGADCGDGAPAEGAAGAAGGPGAPHPLQGRPQPHAAAGQGAPAGPRAGGACWAVGPRCVPALVPGGMALLARDTQHTLAQLAWPAGLGKPRGAAPPPL